MAPDLNQSCGQRGQLRIYLGAAPGVGKTVAMLQEGHRRADRGTDVVIGLVETHGRPRTAVVADGLEVVSRRTVNHRGTVLTELDVDAVLRRRPAVVLVDELAHTNAPGSDNPKRWQDVDELLEAGITVLSTLNVQHLESLNDVVEQITGVPQRETVPDEVVRRADQVELVDMTPEALRRRMAHGNIYPAERIDAALSNYFRPGNLTALRELALLWLAGKVDEQLDRYRSDHRIGRSWETRERVVVALSGGPEGSTLIRRAARIATRTKGAELLAVHVIRNDGLAGADPALLAQQRLLMESLGGTYHQVLGTDVPTALIDFARGVNATQLVLGTSRRGPALRLLSRGVGMTTAALSGSIDVHLVTHEEAVGARHRLRLAGALSARRRLAGFGLVLAGLPLLTWGMHLAQDRTTLSSEILLYLVAVIAVALTGGLWPALLAAVAAFGLLNFFFTAPVHTFTVAERDNLLALVVFLITAAAVSAVVDLAAIKTRAAVRANADAATLAALAGSVLRGGSPLASLLDQMRETFGLDSVTLLSRTGVARGGQDPRRDPAAWRVEASAGEPTCSVPAGAEMDVDVADGLALALRGPVLPAADRRLVEAFAAQAAVALTQQQLAEEAAAARPLAEADRMRTALLAAVSHDLRTPLAAAKAAVAGLRSAEADPGISLDKEDRAELLATAEESLDRLGRLVANLLDMSRLQVGALGVSLIETGLDDVLPRALDELGEPAKQVRLQLPADLPAVRADPGLLERVVVNLVGNALRFSPPDRPPLMIASTLGGVVQLRVVDHGPGIPEGDRELAFRPFQRLGDRDNESGVGLGLALSRGLVEAMGGSLHPDTTPGGGLTMVLGMPAVAPPTHPPGGARDGVGP